MRVAVLILLSAMALVAADAHFDGARVHYESYGSGPKAVVFIHGWTCDLTFWRGQAPIYEKYRSLLIDLPGHGESDKPPVSYTMDYFARAVDAVLRDAGVEHAVLLGHSMGVPVAMAFLHLFPGKAKAMVFVDGYLRWDAPKNSDAIATLDTPNYKTWMSGVVDSMFSSNTSPALRQEIKSKMLATPRQVVFSAWEGMRSAASLARDATFSIPALAILRGGRVNTAYKKRLRSVFPDLRGYETWQGSGHFLMMESPARFNQSLAAFLDSIGFSAP